MSQPRRRFIQTALSTTALMAASRSGMPSEERHAQISTSELDRVAAVPVLELKELSVPIVLTQMELLRNGQSFLSAFGRRTVRRAWAFPIPCT